MNAHRFRALLAACLSVPGLRARPPRTAEGLRGARRAGRHPRLPDHAARVGLPGGHPRALVQADFDLGMKIKLEYVPLIFVIRREGEASRAAEVTDLAKLGDAVAQMRRN